MNTEIDPYVEMLNDEAERIRKESWSHAVWGQTEREKEVGHAHCHFCWATISSEPGTNCEKEGYSKDNQWICMNCYTRIIKKSENPENIVQISENRAS